MRVNSGGCRHGVNFWHFIEDKGTITIDFDRPHKENDKTPSRFVYEVAKGDIKAQEVFAPNSYVHTIFGEKEIHKVGKWDKYIQKELIFKRGSVRAIKDKIDFTEGRRTTFLGVDGMVKQKVRGGGVRGEWFYYRRRKKGKRIQAYYTYYQKPYTEVFYPNGQRWVRLTGKLNFAWKCGYSDDAFILAQKNSVDHLFQNDGWRNNLFMGRNWTIEVWDKKGVLTDRGECENGQNKGEWLRNGQAEYYLQGVKVSKKLYTTPAEKLNPKEILNIDNVQLRASLLGKIGVEKVVERFSDTVIDTDEERGYALFSVPVKPQKTQGNRTSDASMGILKVKDTSTGVFYCLRVPPQLKTCEEARQWSFGKGDLNKVEESDFIRFERET